MSPLPRHPEMCRTTPTVGVKGLVVLLGFSVVFAACSAVAERSPGNDRSTDAQSGAREREDTAVDSSGADTPTPSRPLLADLNRVRAGVL
jgi:hypothetical protein